MAQTHNGTPTAAVEDLLAARPAKEVCLRSIRSEDPAYVSYTSGSTGQPKGVVVPHRGVVRLVKGADYVSLNSEETLLHMSPLSFDASTFELWGALLNGGRLVLLPPGQPSLAEIGAVIRHRGVSTLWLTAALFHLIVDEQLDDLKSLRQLLAGGDVLCPQRVAKARRALPGCRLINGYGPTENTTFTCCFTIGDEQEFTPTVPIGRPIANTRVYILDARRFRESPREVEKRLISTSERDGTHVSVRIEQERILPGGLHLLFARGLLREDRSDQPRLRELRRAGEQRLV